MDPKWQSLFYALAVLSFAAEAFNWRPYRDRMKPQFGWFGLMLFAIPFLYGAVVAGW